MEMVIQKGEMKPFKFDLMGLLSPGNYRPDSFSTNNQNCLSCQFYTHVIPLVAGQQLLILFGVNGRNLVLLVLHVIGIHQDRPFVCVSLLQKQNVSLFK